MAEIYHSGQPLPELALVVRGATTIVLYTPDELEGLQSLCLVAGSSQPDSIASIFHALGDSGATNLSYWAAARAKSDLPIKQFQEVTPTDLKQAGNCGYSGSCQSGLGKPSRGYSESRAYAVRSRSRIQARTTDRHRRVQPRLAFVPWVVAVEAFLRRI